MPERTVLIVAIVVPRFKFMYILYIYAFEMSVHICILMISMFVTLISNISRSITFIKLPYKINYYILTI